VVFFQHREIIGFPCAVGKHSGMPDRGAAGICDFGVIDDARNAVRVVNVLGGVQVVYGTFECAVTVAARNQIPGSIQVYFGERDAAENAVVLHGGGISAHGIGLLIAGDSGRISAIGFVSAALIETNSNDSFAGVDKSAAAVGRGDVGVIIRVTQPYGLTVQCLGDFKGVGAFAQHGTSRAGIGHIRPITVVPAGSAALDNDKTTFVALSVINIV